MGRPAKGWTLRERHGFYTVRFTAHGRDVERSTGVRVSEGRERAASLAPGIYAKEIRTPKPKRKVAARAQGIAKAAEQWLEDEEPLRDEETSATYALYARTHWEPSFETLAGLTEPRIVAYRAERLRKVAATTVSKELGALRAFLRWLGSEVNVPGVPPRATGSRVKTQWTGAQELSPAECERVLRLLPSPARERYTVAYETGLRPATLDQISVPEHWRPRSRHIEIPLELDKARAGRPVPLSDRAQRAIASVAPTRGLLFGPNRHRKKLKAAAAKALPGERGRRFVATDLRAARLTFWLEETANLPGVQALAGHRRATTTARYVKPSLRAAEAVVFRDRKPSRKRATRNTG